MKLTKETKATLTVLSIGLVMLVAVSWSPVARGWQAGGEFCKLPAMSRMLVTSMLGGNLMAGMQRDLDFNAVVSLKTMQFRINTCN